MHTAANNSLEDIDENELVDVVVIGAGPAGSAAAVQAAKSGLKTLLVDRQEFPRDKVCGSCLSGQAVTTLRKMGLENCLDNSIPLTEFVLATPRRQVSLSSRGGRAISRKNLDAQLAYAAIESGAMFLDGTKASPLKTESGLRQTMLSSRGKSISVRSQVVLLCTGLGKSITKAWGLSERVFPKSRIGITTYTTNHSGYVPGCIYMCVSRQGYLGAALLEDGRLNISACIDRQLLRTIAPDQMARELIEFAGKDPPNFSANQRWVGTSMLSRQLKCPAGNRLFVLGDAAGYAEPFTGQGIAWALESAADVAPLVAKAVQRWDDSLISRWQNLTCRRQKKQQRVCNFTKWMSRSPIAMEATVGLLKFIPALASPFLKSIHKV